MKKTNGLDEVIRDTEEIQEDTDEILKRVDKNMKALVKTQKSIMILIALWIIDKIIMWLIVRFG